MDKVLENRRKAMLRTMLYGLFFPSLISLIVDVIESWNYLADEFMIPVMVSALIIILVLLQISKGAPSWLAAVIWQCFVLLLITFTDTPEGLIAGKSSLVSAAYLKFPVISALNVPVVF